MTGVDADKDMHKLNSRLNVHTLKGYGKLMRLFAEIGECVAVLDEGRWPWYLHAGGLTSGNLFKAPTDYLDLDVGVPTVTEPLNPAVKALVVNHTWREAFASLSMVYPAFIADREVAQGLPRSVVNHAIIADDLGQALELACQNTGTDKAIVFDGSYGCINLSQSLGEYLVQRAPDVARRARRVDEELMPKWLKQRSIDPATV